MGREGTFGKTHSHLAPEAARMARALAPKAWTLKYIILKVLSCLRAFSLKSVRVVLSIVRVMVDLGVFFGEVFLDEKKTESNGEIWRHGPCLFICECFFLKDLGTFGLTCMWIGNCGTSVLFLLCPVCR